MIGAYVVSYRLVDGLLLSRFKNNVVYKLTHDVSKNNKNQIKFLKDSPAWASSFLSCLVAPIPVSAQLYGLRYLFVDLEIIPCSPDFSCWTGNCRKYSDPASRHFAELSAVQVWLESLVWSGYYGASHCPT